MKTFFSTLISCSALIFFLGIINAQAFSSIEEDKYDFGDAPDTNALYNYPTLLVNQGASHIIIDGFHLGDNVTDENDGQPGFDALGDWGDDGIFFTSLVKGLSGGVIEVVLNDQGNMGGFLDAWIDFNGDGDWLDSGEYIFDTSQLLVAGTQTISFDIPAYAVGETYARFRLSSAGGLSFEDAAGDGEVEDYKIKINPVPIPNAMILLGAGMIGLAGIGRRKMK